MIFVLFVLAVLFLVLWLNANKKASDATQKSETQAKDIASLEQRLSESQEREKELSQYQCILDAEAEAQKIQTSAQKEVEGLYEDARDAKRKAQEKLSDAQTEADRRISSADEEVKRIIAEAEKKAEDIAGDAYKAMQSVDELRKTERALRNTINGYGDEWLKPAYSLLDELAEEFSYKDAGLKLKDARASSARMVREGLAADCDYVESVRKRTAINFVVDAFNGKVDSILSKTKKDNYGKLEQQILDAYQLVNANGQAFRNARITPEYRDARLQELKWAVVAQELRAQVQEEQRRLREQMREEAKAQKEFERAQKDAAKEEAMLKKAMEKAQAMLEKANDEQKAKYEAQLAELNEKLRVAEEKNQRALSMAQQTRHGNVYVISNIGSFGENVYKVGMTRRLNPLDRVRELGDASVPFAFDVHAIIESDDAPALEHALHQELAMMQVNKVNPRKEFFRASLSDIRALVEKHGLEASWTMAAEAAEYRETLAIEERMKDDPEVQKRWSEFYARIAESTASDEDDED